MSQGKFRNVIKKAEPIILRDQLAETLGAFEDENGLMEYSFEEVVKMAGHPCPIVTGAFLICKKVLENLYKDEIPKRGEISINVFGKKDEGVYGVMSQVFSFITGAAPETGFKGLGPKFNRKNLLKFKSSDSGHSMRFEFKRLDNGKKAVVEFLPNNIPFEDAKAEEMGFLLQKVVWDAAKPEEKKRFQELWMKKISNMLNEKEINKWMKIENE